MIRLRQGFGGQVRVLALILLLAGCAVTQNEAPPLEAQTIEIQCGPRADVLAALNQEYNERTVALGLGKGVVYELLASPAGTWTIIATGPHGISCLALAGEAWQEVGKGAGI